MWLILGMRGNPRLNRKIETLLLAVLLTISIMTVPITSMGNDQNHISNPSEECIVLLHGLARTDRSMKKMCNALLNAGYTIFNLEYPSRKKPIEELSMEFIPKGVAKCGAVGKKRVNFVTHSMGGIVLRYYLTKHAIPELGRVVMLSPPSQGSELVDELRDAAIYKWINGPAGQQLGTGPDGIASRLGPVEFPLGIITGNNPGVFDFWFKNKFPGENDGKVSVERAKVEGMTDFLVLPYGHTFIMDEEEVISQTLHFLHYGVFRRDVSLSDEVRYLRQK